MQAVQESNRRHDADARNSCTHRCGLAEEGWLLKLEQRAHLRQPALNEDELRGLEPTARHLHQPKRDTHITTSEGKRSTKPALVTPATHRLPAAVRDG